ncbi:MAG: protein kinase domain-containing protein [Usitatibacter sp.]
MSEAKRIGKYEVRELIAKAGPSGVYRGADGDKPVALKLMNRAAVSAEALARVQRGAAAAARVRHPAICAFIEAIESDKLLCVVSEPAEGEPLTARVKDGVPYDLRQTWEIARQILEGIESAHSKGVFHGNLKPSNVIVDKDNRVRVTDLGTFGLLDAVPSAYTAPEQLSGEAPDARSDLYQVGAIVYHLVSGKPAFSGTPEEIAHRVRQERPSDPSTFSPRIAWQLDWVIQRALSKDPADRFGSARELLDGLRLGLQDSIGSPIPVPAPPPAEAKHASPKATAAATPTAPIAAAKPAAPAAVAKPAAPAAVAKPAAPAAVAKPAAPAAVAKPAAPAAVAKPAAPAPAMEPAVAKAPAAPGSDLAAKARLIAAAPPSAEPAPAANDRLGLLFVDDDERVLNALRSLFRNEYHVYTALGGEEALALVKRHAIPIVVSDQRMPGMSGVDLLRQVRAESPRTVRMLLTGYSDLAALVGSINEGEVFRFVRKPWDNDEIRANVSDAATAAMKLAQRAAPQPAAISPRTAGSLLVIDPGKSLAEGLERLVAGEATVTLVGTVPEAAKLLQSNEYAAIVADLRAGRDDLVKLFKVVKAKRPETLSLLVAAEADSELVAELINQAQIHRFLAKPIDGRVLRAHVGEALRRYAEFKQAAGRKASGLAQDVGALPASRLVSRTA